MGGFLSLETGEELQRVNEYEKWIDVRFLVELHRGKLSPTIMNIVSKQFHHLGHNGVVDFVSHFCLDEFDYGREDFSPIFMIPSQTMQI